MTSVFKVSAKNQLGLEFQKTRAKLLSLALSKPEDYFKLREEVITAITEILLKRLTRLTGIYSLKENLAMTNWIGLMESRSNQTFLRVKSIVSL